MHASASCRATSSVKLPKPLEPLPDQKMQVACPVMDLRAEISLGNRVLCQAYTVNLWVSPEAWICGSYAAPRRQ